jgi:hypothetical protein
MRGAGCALDWELDEVLMSILQRKEERRKRRIERGKK